MKMLTEKETAELLNCTPAALRRWRRERRGPKWVKVERLIRYTDKDLAEFLMLHTEPRDKNHE